MISGQCCRFFPGILRSSVVALKSLSKVQSHSNVNSGKLFAQTIADLHTALGFPALHASTSLGFSLFFDDMMKKDEAEKWFGEVIPRLAELMEAHYQNAVVFNGNGNYSESIGTATTRHRVS